MSKNYLKDVHNIVDNERSKYYEINKKKRNYWNSRSESISCRVRDYSSKNRASEFAMNVRAYLLNEDKRFEIVLDRTIKSVMESDYEQIRRYASSLLESEDIDDKRIGLIASYLTEEQIAEALDLKFVVSCRLLGYEKELLFLKCYVTSIKPALMLRCLYHLEYNHSKFIEDQDFEGIGSIEKGLSFDLYLNRISFL